MKKCELLSPAGNMEMLKFAIHYGADAVYLAGTKFGARKFANNFNNEELKEAVEYAHLYGVKIYLTINTLIYEREIEEFLKYVEYIHSIGVDAVLVQDFGIMTLLREKFPNLEIHASTQMHTNGSNMIKLLEKYGVKRVVLDREMSLDEIKKLPDTIEKEVFCHGALCVSYSGQCLFSSLILQRSGNRGECAGMCRLPYRLEIDGKVIDKNPKYYLSLKDLCTVNSIKEILDSNVNCLKIEGRMKSPEYVGYMTKIYRELIDSYYEGIDKKISNDEMNNIKLLFNRKLTKGFLNNESINDISNIESPNHIGIPLGTYKVIGKKIELKLTDKLVQGDSIRFKEANKGMHINFLYDIKDKLINSSEKNTKVYVDNFLDIEGFGEIRKISSITLENEIRNYKDKKINITGTLEIKENEPLKLIINDGKNNIEVLGDKVEKAQNRPTTEEEIKKQINKTGNTIYNFTNLKIIKSENVFIGIKSLNELRREALIKLNEKRIHVPNIVVSSTQNRECKTDNRQIQLNIKVSNKEQYNISKKYTNNIFTDNIDLYEDLKKQNNIYYKHPENPKMLNENKYMISDYGSIINKKDNDIIHSDYMFNVYNTHSIYNLIELGVNTICLSPELNINEIIELQLKTNSSYLEVLVYGKIELMKMKYTPYISNETIKLIDRNNKKYLIKKIKDMYYCMHHTPINYLDEINLLTESGIKNFRIDFIDESPDICEKILEKAHKIIYKE